MDKNLHEMTTEELGKLFPIILSESKSNWKSLYQAEKKLITKGFKNPATFKIAHIGSTAVSGLISKPTIDILLEIDEGTDTTRVIETIKKLGYEYIHKPENPPPNMMFVKGYTRKGFSGQAFHIHVRYFGDWDELYFRDYLRQHPETATAYGVLKQKLAKKHKYNREAYTDAKTAFIKKITSIARNTLSEGMA